MKDPQKQSWSPLGLSYSRRGTETGEAMARASRGQELESTKAEMGKRQGSWKELWVRRQT